MANTDQQQNFMGMWLNQGHKKAIEKILIKEGADNILNTHKNKIRNLFPDLYVKYIGEINLKDERTFDEIVAAKYINKAENARQRGLDFNISLTSVKNIMKAKQCFYTRLPLDAATITIDRKDHRKGYIMGNVVACHSAVNSLKSIFEDKVSMDNKQLKRLLNRWSSSI